MEEEKKMKLCFSIPSKPKVKPATPPAAFSVAAVAPGPAPRFVTVFDPSETLTPAPAVIAPLPDSRKPSPAAAAPAAPVVIAPLPNTRRLAEAPAFVLGASDSRSSSAAYGLTVRNTDSKRKLEPQDDAASQQPPPPGPSGEDLMLRRFKEDMAVLPEIQGTDEYDEVPVEGFGAALLAGYGWKEGDPIGKKYKGMGDVKVREHGRRRCGTQGLGS
ncbi:protein MOS2-like [Triticum urartu]|uniref:protein MOS2-like n=1 Tax=Triticum urartu TaxID=4572 RepID=UPI002043D5AE|nr:protein MOS2-like [Triticum urartu]